MDSPAIAEQPVIETSAQQTLDAQPPRVWRVEVRPWPPEDDPLGRNVLAEAREAGLGQGLTGAQTARIFLLEGPLDQRQVERIAAELLCDPVNQRYSLGAAAPQPGAAIAEVHYLPGVMDPVAQSTQDAIAEMLGGPAHGSPNSAEASAEAAACQVRTGFRYDLPGASTDQAQAIARRLLANEVIQSIHGEPYHPDQFARSRSAAFKITQVPIRDLDDEGLARLSRDGHLFLSQGEMKAIQDYYRAAGREPRDVELETLAQTWSEHCVHKTLKSTVSYSQAPGAPGPGPADWAARKGHELLADGTLVVRNLLKSTIAAATFRLMEEGINWCVSVFVDNAGVIDFDAADCVSFKVETHNHPSAIEPYGGAATGIGGCIRDTMGTGLGARPIANTDVFCVASPDYPQASLPKGVLHPQRVLKQVVAGVRDYGNRMGIPTVNGALYFDDRYLGNPLVYCGSVGLIPRDKCFGKVRAGDRIIALGGRTGRDGIHGATFSSAELTDTHADEFSHAVQIGNAITEKKALDVMLQARDHESGCLYSAVTDCGAGGFSSAIGEMGKDVGAFVQLENAPLKYQGLSYTEIWISEAQERMVLSVPEQNVAALKALADSEDVEISDLGQFGTPHNDLILTYHGTEVGRIDMHFLHEGIPTPTRQAVWNGPTAPTMPRPTRPIAPGADITSLLPALLGHPNIASKHWVIRQYDHEVQGGSVIKPLTGVKMDGPSDAAVIRPKLDSMRGISLSCGLATAMGDLDPYWMTLAAIDEAIRNAVCVGARPDRIAILDNFCWPNCAKPENLGSLVRASQACYDGAIAYRTPFISGKDSLNNEFKTESGQTIAIPPTLLISAIGMVDNVGGCVTMDAKAPGNLLIQVGQTTDAMGGSHVNLLRGLTGGQPPKLDLKAGPATAAAVAALIQTGMVRSAHDCSEGGLLVAAAEMAFAGGLGLSLDLAGVPTGGEPDLPALCYAETPGRYLLEIDPASFDALARTLRAAGIAFGQVGRFDDSGRLSLRSPKTGPIAQWSLDALKAAWLKPLDW